MLQGPPTRVAGISSGGGSVHAVRVFRRRHRHRPAVPHISPSADRQDSTHGCNKACTVSCSDSTSAQKHRASVESACQQHCNQNSRRLWLLPTVAAHQLYTSLHMQSHAAESVPPAAFALFREFLVRVCIAPINSCNSF